MSGEVSPLMRALLEAATKQRTGELVVLVETREFHVYFREGLIAWAADSAEPAQFSRVIKKVCDIADDALPRS